MKDIIKKILSEEVEKLNPLTKSEAILFKYLNTKRRDAKTRAELLDLIKSTLRAMGLSDSKAKAYYSMYVDNYRPKGDYENLTYMDFVGPLTKKEIVLFKVLNSKHEQYPTKASMTDFIRATLHNMGLDPDLAMYYYQLYILNYREDAHDYNKIRHDEFEDVTKFKSKTISNTQAYQYTRAKVPFKGSNLDGTWKTDRDDVKYYVVTSYGWYPIYLYKDGIWYEVNQRYSSSTGRQMSNAYPFRRRYNNDIKETTILVTREEMDKLQSGATYDDIIKGKKERLIKNRNQYIDDRFKHTTYGWGTQGEDREMKVKFKVTDIKEENGKVVIYVLVDDAGPVEGRKLVPTKGGYLRGEVPNITKERVETTIKRHILSQLTEYIGRGRYYSDEIPDESAITFNFSHFNEK